MRMKKENDRRNHVGTTFEMAFDTTPTQSDSNLICSEHKIIHRIGGGGHNVF